MMRKRLRIISPQRLLNLSALLVVCLTLVLALSGCKTGDKDLSSAENYEIEEKFERGPVAFYLKVDRKKVSIAERVKLVLEVHSKENYQVKLPDFGDKLDQFGIVDYHEPSPKLTKDDLISASKVYTLEPFLSGEYKIPPMQVLFWKKGEEKQYEVESSEIAVEVVSLLPEDTKDLHLKDITPPVSLPRDRKWLFYLLAAVILIAAGGAGIYFYRKYRKKEEPEEKELPHEVAYTALAVLLAEELIEKGMIKEFYLRLSNILRHYIEDRFGMHAPERTTEEFLLDLRRAEALINTHKELLKGFLQHSDMVKFAAHQPGNDEIQGAFDACKRFIVETEVQKITEKEL